MNDLMVNYLNNSMLANAQNITGVNQDFLRSTTVLRAARSERTKAIARLEHSIALAQVERSKAIANLFRAAGNTIGKALSGFSWNAIVEAHKFRKSCNELHALSDEILHDIGVQRSAIGETVRSLTDAKNQVSTLASVEAPVGSSEVETPSAVNYNKIDQHIQAA